MGIIKRWNLQNDRELENSIAWAMTGFQGDRNARLAIANALATRQLEINFPDIIPTDNNWRFDPVTGDIASAGTAQQMIAIYAEGFKQLAHDKGEPPDFLVIGIGLMRSPLLPPDMKMNQAPLLAQAARIAFGNDIPVVFCNNAQRTWDDIIIHEHYDFVVAPSYLPQTDDPRAVACFGIPHLVSRDTIDRAVIAWNNELSQFRKADHVIAVLLGGPMWKSNTSAENIPFTEAQATEFGRQVRNFATEKNAVLLVTNSHRTPPEASRAFMAEITDLPVFFYDWEKEGGQNNPYFAFLGTANTIIATGDSISMPFEAASTGKPVYIALPQGASYPEQRNAIDTLVMANFAREFDGSWHQWEIPEFPNYIQEVGNEIRAKLAAKMNWSVAQTVGNTSPISSPRELI